MKKIESNNKIDEKEANGGSRYRIINRFRSIGVDNRMLNRRDDSIYPPTQRTAPRINRRTF
jgi:hypothetical protein